MHFEEQAQFYEDNVSRIRLGQASVIDIVHEFKKIHDVNINSGIVNIDISAFLAGYYLKIKDFDLATKILDESLKINHTEPRFLEQRMFVFLNQEQFKKLDIWLGDLLARMPDNPILVGMQGYTFRRMGYFDMATSIMVEREKSHGDLSFNALSELANMYQDAIDYDNAINYYRLALHRSPNDFFSKRKVDHCRECFVVSLVKQSQIIRLRYPDEAQKLCDEAYQIFEVGFENPKQLHALVWQMKYVSEVYRRGIRSVGSYNSFCVNLKASLKMANTHILATDEYEDDRVISARAAKLVTDGYSKALDYIIEAVSRQNKVSASLYGQLVSYAIYDRKYNVATEFLEKGLSEHPNHSYLRLRKSQLLLAVSDYSGAIDIAAELFRENSKNHQAKVIHCLGLLMRGDNYELNRLVLPYVEKATNNPNSIKDLDKKFLALASVFNPELRDVDYLTNTLKYTEKTARKYTRIGQYHYDLFLEVISSKQNAKQYEILKSKIAKAFAQTAIWEELPTRVAISRDAAISAGSWGGGQRSSGQALYWKNRAPK